jgi:hypothetical protein
VARGRAGGGGSGMRHRVDRSGWRRRGREGGRRGVERAGDRGSGGQAGRVGLDERCGVGWSGVRAGVTRVRVHRARLVGWIVWSK